MCTSFDLSLSAYCSSRSERALARLPFVEVDDRAREERLACLAGRPRGLQGFGQLLLGLAGLAGVEQIHGESLVRVQEGRIDFERLAVLDDRVVEAAHLQKELGVGVVRIRVPGKDLDVFLKRLLRARVVSALPVGVAEQVVGVRVVRGDLRGLLVVLDRGSVVLLPEVVAGDVEVGPLVVGIGGHELLQIVLLPRRVGGRSGLVREDQEPLPVRRLVGERHGLVQVIEELGAVRRGVGERELGPREVRVERYRLLKVSHASRCRGTSRTSRAPAGTPPSLPPRRSSRGSSRRRPASAPLPRPPGMARPLSSRIRRSPSRRRLPGSRAESRIVRVPCVPPAVIVGYAPSYVSRRESCGLCDRGRVGPTFW